MTNNSTDKTTWQVIKEVPQQIVTFISEGVKRIFGPRDDNYPEVGTQPFDGEPADQKKHY